MQVRLPLAVCILIGLAFLQACSNVEESLKPAELVDFEKSIKLKKVWGKSIGAGHSSIDSRFNVVADGERIYASDDKGKVFALDASTGKTIWQSNVKVKVGGGVGIGKTRVFIGSLEGEVIALNAENGEEEWRANASSEIVVPPGSNGDVVVVPAIDGRLFAFDAKTGEIRWSYDHPRPVLTYRPQAAPLVIDSQVFIAFDNGQLMSFAAADGQLRWTARVSQPEGSTELERTIDLDSTPVSSGPFVYAAGINGKVAAINKGTGRVLWSQDVSTYYNIVADDDYVYVTTEEGHLHAYTSTSGRLEWENKDLHRRGLRSPGLIDEYVAVADDKGYLHVVSKKEGKFVERIKPDGSDFESPFLSHDNKLYILSRSGKLSVYEVAPI